MTPTLTEKHFEALYFMEGYAPESDAKGLLTEMLRQHVRAIAELPAILRAQQERIAEMERCTDMLETMFDAYENGVDCYEGGEPDEGAYIGPAFRLDDSDFHEIAMFLNKHRPRTDGAATPPQAPSCNRPNVACAYPECGDSCRHRATPQAPAVPCDFCGGTKLRDNCFDTIECMHCKAPAPQQGAVPDGWRLVPKMPTEEMLRAGIRTFQHAYSCDDPLADWRATYGAYLLHAPQPNTSSPDHGEGA